ncbi:MAG: glycosyltransferase family 9 protein [Pseudomonadota bacterium]
MKILIIKLGALGDVVMATPLIEAIQSTYPNGDIHLLTTPQFASIFTSWEGIQVHTYPRRGWAAMWSIINFVRRGHFDTVFDLQGNDRTSLICALSGAQQRVGNHPRFPYTHHPKSRWRGDSHIFERMTSVLQAARVEVTNDIPVIPVDATQRDKVDRWLTERALHSVKLVAIHASASAARAEKCWPHFAELANKLLPFEFTPVWLGSKDEAPSNAALIAASGGINACGEFSIPELAYFSKRISFAVTNDSGPMHALAVGGQPIYGLFGPSDWRRNHALGQAQNVISSTDDFGAIDKISVDQVWRRLLADHRLS